MRLGARILASVLLLTMYLPVGVAQADSGDAIALTALPASETAGVADTTVTVMGMSSGSTDTSYTGTVTFTSSDTAAVLPGPYTFVLGDNGVHAFSVTFKTAGPQTLTVTDNSAFTDNSSTDVAAGAPATLVLTGSTADLQSGVTRDLTAVVTDAFSNPVPNQLVSFSQSGGSGSVDFPGNPTTDGSGSATETITGDQTGTVTVTATAGAGTDDLGPFNVTFGALDHVVVSPNTASIAPAGSQPYTTAAFDANGNSTDVTGSEVLVITPNGSCSAGSCTASISGAHTVTSSFGGKSDTATLTVGDNPPVAVDDAATVLENSGLTAIDVLGNDTDVDPDTLTVTVVGNPPHGTATIDGGGGGVHYTPDAHYSGSDSFTYTVSDGHGGTDVGTVSVTVTFVNEAPSFTKGANQVVNENVTAQTVSNWATAISPGPGNGDVGQAVNFIVTNDNNGLFSAQPAVSSTGTLTYTPTTNVNGSATVSVSLHDNGGTSNGGTNLSAVQTFTITVNGVNQAPSFTGGGGDTTLEDSGTQSLTNWATGMSPGPANESAQVLNFIVTNDNNALFSVQPAVDATTGTLTYTPAANANGSSIVTVKLHDNGGVANGGHDTSAAQTMTIGVTAVNDIPSFTKGPDQSVIENAGAQTVPGWASGLSKGPADESAQTLNFIVSNNNNPLFSTQPAVSAAGNLTYTPASNASGVATVSVQIHDTGGTANGGQDTSAIQTFTITVSLLNHAPSFTKGGDDTLLEDAAAHTDSGWATGMSPGPANESGQALDFIVTNNNNPLFSAQPAINATSGDLTYTLAPNANGVATVTVKLHDNGGTANGGVDTSAAQTMTITVTAVNDAPSFTGGGDRTVLENAGAQSINGWATSISDGPLESGQVLNFIVTNDANALFSVQPAISAAGVLTFTPTANVNGSATVTVKLHDNGGVANGGVDTSATQTFVINVTHVNQVPTFTKGADQTVLENSSAQTVPGWVVAKSPGADLSEAGQALNFIVTNDSNALFSVQPAISASGVLTYTPAVNKNGTAIVSVQVHDNGGVLNGGLDTSAIQTFTITLTLVNQAPSFVAGADVVVNEDAGAQALAGWATSISSGPGDPSQGLTFTVTNGNNPLFSVQPAVTANGALTFTTAANANGSAMVTLSLKDDGGTLNGGADTSPTQTFLITVNAVNDAPTFVLGETLTVPCPTSGATVTCSEEASPATHSFAGWAHGFNPGPADESSQTVVHYTVSNNANNLFSTQPSINAGGTLSFRLAANRNGSATVSVSVQDSGGTANGGVDTSVTQTFTIAVTGVDHAPAAITDTATVIQGSGPNTIDVLANDFDPDGDAITIIGVAQGSDGHVVIAANKQSVSYDPTGLFFGQDQFQYEISDGRGAIAFGTVVVTVQKDTFGPVATTPKIWTKGVASTSVSILLSWTGTDVGSGVKYYQLQESHNGGTFVAVSVPVGATSVTRTIVTSGTYQYRVRGIDQVGNVGAWVLSAVLTPALAPHPGVSRHTGSALAQAGLGIGTGVSASRRIVPGIVIQP